MVRKALFASCAAALLVLFVAPLHAKGKPSGKEFKDGWNTYANAKVGDWVEYQITAEQYKRVEVVEVAGESVKISDTLVTKGEKGKPSEKKPVKWWDLRVPFSIPPGTITWSTQKVTLGSLTIDCDVASWVNGNLACEVYLAKSVPCSGFIKQVMGGTAAVWLRNYGDKDNKEGVVKGSTDPNEGKAPALPEFYKQIGNVTVYKVTNEEGSKYFRREVVEHEGPGAKLSEIACDKEGKPAEGVKAVEIIISEEDWGKNHAKPAATALKIKVAAGEFTCNMFEYADGDKKIKEWLTETGVMVKSEIKVGEKTTTLELHSLKQK